MTPPMVPLDALTIETFGRLFRARRITSSEVTDQCLRRIADHSDLNAFIRVMADEARGQAALADREIAAGVDRGALHGVPISIKDLLDVAGTPTTAASRVREGHAAAHDAPVVAMLREAGAVFVGKTNLHEFAFGTTNEESAFGPALNPHDRGHSPGGSSGGSAVSVATGMSLATIGTDTGGSIRIPAAACGVVGLKPSYGEVSTAGVVPLSRSLDHVGPLTRTVSDAWSVYRVLADVQETSSAPNDLAPAPIRGMRVAVPRPYFCDLLDDDVRARFEEAIERLRQSGVRVEDTRIAHAHDIVPIYLALVFADAAAYHATTLETMPERYTSGVRVRLELGRYVLAEDYARALVGRDVLRGEVDSALEGRDALVLPTLPIPAPPLGLASVTLGDRTEPVRNLMLRLTQLFNLTGHPAISLPNGVTSVGLPCGLQMVGHRQQTHALVRAALACEGVIGLRSRLAGSQP
jgi:aspartyl-tRNA(Asn)/glutamyl-tRNA(Gln) amidotransferase subunit A